MRKYDRVIRAFKIAKFFSKWKLKFGHSRRPFTTRMSSDEPKDQYDRPYSWFKITKKW